jgi:hypothetical protein
MLTGKNRFLLVCIFIFVVSLACSLPALPANKSVVATIVASTLVVQPAATQPTVPAIQPVATTAASPVAIPTPVPQENRRPTELSVAFIGPDRNVYSWSQSRGVVKILEYGDASDLKISEDGRLVAVSRSSDNQQSSLWVVGFDGSNPRELVDWKGLSGLKTSPDSLGTDPYNLQWIPGTHLVTFSTREVFEGPGMALNDDLIVADADKGGWSIKLKPGKAGLVTYSLDGRWMAVSTAEKISIMNTNENSSPVAVLQFPPVITYSEYRYYPTPQWASDNSRLAVVIPAADPLAEPRQPASVWTMSVQGGYPILQAQVVPQFIGPVSISPDLSKMFYVKEVGAKEENKREIRTAMINGQNDRSIFSGGIPVIWNWNPDSEVFTFQTDTASLVTVSQMNGSVGDLQGTRNIEWFKWVDSKSYLFARINGANEEIMLGKWGEGSFSIAALPKSDMFRMQVDFTR